MASSRKKANSKVVLILVLIIIVILLAWYFAFYTPTLANIENIKLDISSKQSEVDMLAGQKEKQDQMLADIEYLKTVNPAVPAFDNYKQLATVLDVILAHTEEFTLSFQPTKATASSVAGVETVRRVVNVNFNSETYQKAKEIIEDIQDIPFRLQISNVSITMLNANIYRPELENEEDEIIYDSLGDSPVATTLTVTFYENNYV